VCAEAVRSGRKSAFPPKWFRCPPSAIERFDATRCGSGVDSCSACGIAKIRVCPDVGTPSIAKAAATSPSPSNAVVKTCTAQLRKQIKANLPLVAVNEKSPPDPERKSRTSLSARSRHCERALSYRELQSLCQQIPDIYVVQSRMD